MNPLLISGFGTIINVDKRNLIIQNKLDNKKSEFRPHKIPYDSIIIDGHTGNITFEAMRWLVKHNIEISLLNWNGNMLSTTLPEPPKSGKLRIKQYQKYLDYSFRMKISKKIIQIKIMHAMNLLEQLSQFYKLDYKSIKEPISDSKTISDLMTYEGRIAINYFEQVSKIINEIVPEFGFDVRKSKANSRNYNASDPVNALFNYGYSILESEIRKAVNAVGLDNSIGFLHEISQSKSPLVYDLQELFRWIIDYSVIQLLEEKNLKKSDFIVTESYHIRLRENTAKLLIEKISGNFNTKAPYKNKKYYYQTILFENVRNLANHILDKTKQFDFDIPKFQINRNDSIQLQDKIVNITTKERKKLGINKSTLWYVKRNFENGKKVKLYHKLITKLE